MNDGEFKALIHSRNWRDHSTSILPIRFILVYVGEANVSLFFYSYGTNYRVEDAEGNVEELGVLPEESWVSLISSSTILVGGVSYLGRWI